MNENVEKILNEANEYLSDSEEYQGMNIQYVLLNKQDWHKSEVYADRIDEAIILRPFYDREFIQNVPEWDFNFDGYVFEPLNQDYSIGYMTMETHYGIWCSLNELYPEDIDNKQGVINYLKYCKENGITKEMIDKEMKLDVPDVMQYLDIEPLDKFDIVEYKGYVVQVDDSNYDEPSESIVYIYKSKQDMIDGNYIEQISLKNENLKNYIKEYIDETFIDKALEENDKHYITFVLGYDLLNDMTHNSSSPECDVNYDFCTKIAEKFMNSDYYKDSNHSMYEMLESWIQDNKIMISDDYKDFIGVEDKRTRTLDNGIYVMNLGFRKEQPIALVEKSVGDNKQYIVAFNYVIRENKMEWAYAYYYENSKDKAIEDFKKVTSGGDIADSFKEKTNER